MRQKSLDIDIEPEATQLNNSFFILQKVSTIIIVIIILAALLGFFGTGWVSHTHVKKDTLKIDFEKYIRKEATTQYTLRLKDVHLCQNKFIDLWLNQGFFKNASLKSINPKPAKEMVYADKIRYQFSCQANLSKMDVVISLEPEQFGIRKVNIGTTMDNGITIQQIVYP